MSEKAEDKVLIDSLVEKALTGKNIEFTIIDCYKNYLISKVYYYGVRKFYKAFKKSRKLLEEDYCKAISDGANTLDYLITLSKINRCIEYYKKELEIVKSMLEEYRVYFYAGHVTDILTGKQRTEDTLVDFREYLY